MKKEVEVIAKPRQIRWIKLKPECYSSYLTNTEKLGEIMKDLIVSNINGSEPLFTVNYLTLENTKQLWESWRQNHLVKKKKNGGSVK